MSDFLYDCRGSEHLEHTSIEDAVEEWLELFLSLGCDVRAVIRTKAPVEVTKWRKDEVTDKFVESEARRLLEIAAEDFVEEYGDPDGYDDGLNDEAVVVVLPAMKAALWKFLAHGNVWRHEKVGSLVLDAEEVEKMMRVHRPSWFGG